MFNVGGCVSVSVGVCRCLMSVGVCGCLMWVSGCV